jgi:GNAT superfamily N-acetyltransferase
VRGVGELGCALEGFDTMTLQDSLRDAVMLDGMLVRALDGIDDWTKAEALQAEVGLEDGRDPKTYGPYLAGRNVGWGNQITRGIGQWFGAFEGDQIVAQLGMFHDDSIALYQSVETRATHRRRGICSALLRHAALWALGRAPNAVVVIVAEADTDEGRLYCKMGFAHSETIYGIVQDGY